MEVNFTRWGKLGVFVQDYRIGGESALFVSFPKEISHSWYSHCPFKEKNFNFRLPIITGFAVIRGQRLSLSYLENMSQNQTTSKFMEVYIVMNICFSKGPLIKGGCDLKVQPRPENR